jgi:heptosyltransferase-2/heptosyltransferase-3
MKKIKRIIIVDLMYLGDLLFAHPFFEQLRKLFPDARIDLAANNNFAEIMRINPNIDHVYNYNKNWTAARSYKFSKKLKMNNYHLGLNIQGNWRTAILLKLISPQLSIGFGSKGRGIFLDHEIDKKEDHQHMVDFYLDFLKKITEIDDLELNQLNDQSDNLPELNLSDSQFAKGVKKVESIGLEQDFITLNTGGSWETKRWPAEYFAKLADNLIAKGEKVLFVGGPSDNERVQHVLDMIDDRHREAVYDLSGKTSLIELAAVLKKSKLMISGDTGPVHVAAAVGTNTAAVFGPSDEKKYAPKGKGKNILIKNVDLDCRPCGEHECPLEHHLCMRDICPDELVKKLETEELI